MRDSANHQPAFKHDSATHGTLQDDLISGGFSMAHIARGRSVPQRQPARLPLWLIGAGILLLPIVAILIFSGGTARSTETLAPESTMYDFGSVRINGGDIVARFPIAVSEETRVTSITTS
jgi:hypothetical protein